MTEWGQTFGFSVQDFIHELDRYFPVSNLDYVFINSEPIHKNIIKKYLSQQAMPVVNNLSKKYKFKIIQGDLIRNKTVKKQQGDHLKRSLIRHDPDKLARLCIKTLNLI